MPKASDNVFPRLLISEGGSTTTPASGNVTVYAKADGLLYSKDDAGAETALGGASGAVATDTIWDAAGDLAVGSGANTAARLAIGAAGGAVSRINGAVAWNSGTSFPGSAATGDRYWRTDLRMEFFYDGTRWLCTCPHHLSMPIRALPPFSATGTAAQVPLPFGVDVYVETVEALTQVNAGNNTSPNHWTIVFNSTNISAAAVQALGTISTSGNGAAWQRGSATVNLVVDSSSTAEAWIHAVATKNGTAGNLTWIACSLTYRFIGA